MPKKWISDVSPKSVHEVRALAGPGVVRAVVGVDRDGGHYAGVAFKGERTLWQGPLAASQAESLAVFMREKWAAAAKQHSQARPRGIER